jgi:phage tail tape-measure protein
VQARVLAPGGRMMVVGWRMVNGHKTWVARYLGGPTKEASERAMKTAGRLLKIGEGAGIVGNALNVVIAGTDQYGEDADRKDLSTTDKVGRVAAASAYKGGVSIGGGLAGAEVGLGIGASLGSIVPIGGTTVGGVVGAVIGGAIGSGLGEYLADKTKRPFLNAGAEAANLAVDAAETAQDVVEGAGKVLNSISPF